MDYFDVIIMAVIALPLVILAMFMLRGKGASLISGINTMSDEKRETYDEKAVCRAVGKLLLAMAVIMVALPVTLHLEAMWLFGGLIALSVVGPIGFAIYANTSNRYRKPIVEDDNLEDAES